LQEELMDAVVYIEKIKQLDWVLSTQQQGGATMQNYCIFVLWKKKT
jgi:hypothetical protein